MAFITTDDGLKIYYEQRGSGSAVLLSHGFRASSAMWQNQIAALSEHYRVITWDMRGHGRSDSPDDPEAYSLERRVADMAAILRECGTDRAVIGGLSLGGLLSLAFHLVHPNRTAALLLFDTGPGKRRPAGRERKASVANEPPGFTHTRRRVLEHSDEEMEKNAACECLTKDDPPELIRASKFGSCGESWNVKSSLRP